MRRDGIFDNLQNLLTQMWFPDPKMGLPPVRWMVFSEKSQAKLDENWRYPWRNGKLRRSTRQLRDCWFYLMSFVVTQLFWTTSNLSENMNNMYNMNNIQHNNITKFVSTCKTWTTSNLSVCYREKFVTQKGQLFHSWKIWKHHSQLLP